MLNASQSAKFAVPVGFRLKYVPCLCVPRNPNAFPVQNASRAMNFVWGYEKPSPIRMTSGKDQLQQLAGWMR